MRVASVLIDGQPSCGLVTDDGLVDAAKYFGDSYRNLRNVIAGGHLKTLAGINDRPVDIPTDKIVYTSLLPDAEKFLCVGLNYVAHREEAGRKPVGHPTMFNRFASAQVGHLQAMIRPKVSTQFDFEGELAVIIGKRGRHIPPEDAFSHIIGYSCFNDGSIRDWQRHTSQFAPGKNFVASGSFGPWLVTTDEIPDPARLTLETRLNGEVVQHATTDELIFDIPTLIAYVSTYCQLEPGDVVVTGTPSGVGTVRTPPLYMKAGDVIEVEISEIGTLRNPIVDEA